MLCRHHHKILSTPRQTSNQRHRQRFVRKTVCTRLPAPAQRDVATAHQLVIVHDEQDRCRQYAKGTDERQSLSATAGHNHGISHRLHGQNAGIQAGFRDACAWLLSACHGQSQQHITRQQAHMHIVWGSGGARLILLEVTGPDVAGPHALMG